MHQAADKKEAIILPPCHRIHLIHYSMFSGRKILELGGNNAIIGKYNFWQSITSLWLMLSPCFNILCA